ncbi:hypothetical protein PVAP13_1KG049077 [Panicum virgatum]|uniref:Uncharacterized protein n=1 Tax=Panicum virgatum TaxID=38727 RepID=A0A8T0X2Q8_PANVG|nr:hypothetical protein PVAP13_1KG049077 [Panicum virgatum]
MCPVAPGRERRRGRHRSASCPAAAGSECRRLRVLQCKAAAGNTPAHHCSTPPPPHPAPPSAPPSPREVRSGDRGCGSGRWPPGAAAAATDRPSQRRSRAAAPRRA